MNHVFHHPKAVISGTHEFSFSFETMDIFRNFML